MSGACGLAVCCKFDCSGRDAICGLGLVGSGSPVS